MGVLDDGFVRINDPPLRAAHGLDRRRDPCNAFAAAPRSTLLGRLLRPHFFHDPVERHMGKVLLPPSGDLLSRGQPAGHEVIEEPALIGVQAGRVVNKFRRALVGNYLLGVSRVDAGLDALRCFLNDPLRNEVRHAVFQVLRPGLHDPVQRFARVLQRHGVECRGPEEILGLRWRAGEQLRELVRVLVGGKILALRDLVHHPSDGIPSVQCGGVYVVGFLPNVEVLRFVSEADLRQHPRLGRLFDVPAYMPACCGQRVLEFRLAIQHLLEPAQKVRSRSLRFWRVRDVQPDKLREALWQVGAASAGFRGNRRKLIAERLQSSPVQAQRSASATPKQLVDVMPDLVKGDGKILCLFRAHDFFTNLEDTVCALAEVAGSDWKIAEPAGDFAQDLDTTDWRDIGRRGRSWEYRASAPDSGVIPTCRHSPCAASGMTSSGRCWYWDLSSRLATESIGKGLFWGHRTEHCRLAIASVCAGGFRQDRWFFSLEGLSERQRLG